MLVYFKDLEGKLRAYRIETDSPEEARSSVLDECKPDIASAVLALVK